MSIPAGPHVGILHKYTKKLTAFELGPSTSPAPPNLLLWIGGLGDGLLTVSYPLALASSLPPTWSLAQALLSSSSNGWGTSTLARDASELSKCVSYFRSQRPNGKIVLMGHSTGCQDAMEYLTGPGAQERPAIDGGVLQAPVSDREALFHTLGKETYDNLVGKVKKLVDGGKGGTIPDLGPQETIFHCPVTASRWLSLLSPDKKGADDYFSTDLPDSKLESSFGIIPGNTKMCLLYSGKDEHVPEWVEKEKLVEKWIGFVKKGGGSVDERNSGVVDGATHNLEGDSEGIVGDLVGRVVRFLEGLEGDGKANL